MNTNGHYNVTYGLYSISRIRCLHCDFSVHPHDYLYCTRSRPRLHDGGSRPRAFQWLMRASSLRLI